MPFARKIFGHSHRIYHRLVAIGWPDSAHAINQSGQHANSSSVRINSSQSKTFLKHLQKVILHIKRRISSEAFCFRYQTPNLLWSKIWRESGKLNNTNKRAAKICFLFIWRTNLGEKSLQYIEDFNLRKNRGKTTFLKVHSNWNTYFK